MLIDNTNIQAENCRQDRRRDKASAVVADISMARGRSAASAAAVLAAAANIKKQADMEEAVLLSFLPSFPSF